MNLPPDVKPFTSEEKLLALEYLELLLAVVHQAKTPDPLVLQLDKALKYATRSALKNPITSTPLHERARFYVRLLVLSLNAPAP